MPKKSSTDEQDEIASLVDKGKVALEQRREERKEKRAERKEQKITARATEVKGGSTYSGKNFTLKEAKLYAEDESKQHRKPLYVNVTEVGDFDFSLRYDPKSSLHCYVNGSEVAMVIPKKNGTKTIKQTAEAGESETQEEMATSTAKKATPAKKVTGGAKIQKLTIKAIVGLLKKGMKVRHERGFLPKLKNLTKKNQDLVWPVSVEGKA